MFKTEFDRFDFTSDSNKLPTFHLKITSGRDHKSFSINRPDYYTNISTKYLSTFLNTNT